MPRQRNLQFTPYILGSAERGGTLSGTETNEEIGFDVKYSITPSLTLDATYNTDFAQVEVDDQQVNLDRFSLFFPEKREFFLDNAGQFTVGNPREAELFFSRRIGISGGQPVPIDGGPRTRLTALRVCRPVYARRISKQFKRLDQEDFEDNFAGEYDKIKENLHVSKGKKRVRMILSYFIFLVLIAVAGAFGPAQE